MGWIPDHVQLTGSRTRPSMVKVHWSRGVRGVGPAESTGKSGVTCWPGGSGSGAVGWRLLPTKPREMNDCVTVFSSVRADRRMTPFPSQPCKSARDRAALAASMPVTAFAYVSEIISDLPCHQADRGPPHGLGSGAAWISRIG